MPKWVLTLAGGMPRSERSVPTSREIELSGSGGQSDMTGIQFLTDEKGRKTAAVIDLKVHRELWEDLQDVLVSKTREHERGVPLAKVKADLIKRGKLRG